MTTVVPFTYGDTAGVQQNQGGMKGCKTGGIAHSLSADESRKDRLEAGCVWGKFARVDVVVTVKFVLSELAKLLKLEGVNIPLGRQKESNSPAH